MARRPFASLLLLAGCALLLVLALLIAVYPRPLQGAILRCTQAGSLCFQVLMAGRAAGSSFLLLLVPALLGWSAYRGGRAIHRQLRATRAALDRAGATGVLAPGPALANLCADLGLAGRIAVVAGDTPLALCHGLLRPRIWISQGALALLTPSELRAVLRHERAHLRRRDPLRLLLARTLAAGLPFLPVLGELAGALPLAQELAADRAVLREQGRDDLARALLALTEQGADFGASTFAAGMVGSLDARLDQLMGEAVVQPRLSCAALLATALVLAGGLAVVMATSLAARSRAFAPAAPMWDGRVPWRCALVLATGVAVRWLLHRAAGRWTRDGRRP